MGILYMVATPIGNMEDITLRAIRTLKEVAFIAAEDTRRTRLLLDRYEIRTPMVSFHEHSGEGKLDYLARLLEEHDVAVVSEAGMPGISDPGYDLVRIAVEKSIRVVPIPGASAVVTALAVSGLPTAPFLFLGFLATKDKDRRELLAEMAGHRHTLVVFESPHRLPATLAELKDILGDRRLAVCRELTKLHEEVFRGTISGATEHFCNPRGEFVLVIEGAPANKEGVPLPDALAQVARLVGRGVTAKQAIAEVAVSTGLARNVLYREWHLTRQTVPYGRAKAEYCENVRPAEK